MSADDHFAIVRYTANLCEADDEWGNQSVNFTTHTCPHTTHITAIMADVSDAVALEPYIHQVGGRSNMLATPAYDVICKPMKQSDELDFYANLPDILKPYTPAFKGLIDVTIDETEDGSLSFTGRPAVSVVAPGADEPRSRPHCEKNAVSRRHAPSASRSRPHHEPRTRLTVSGEIRMDERLKPLFMGVSSSADASTCPGTAGDTCPGTAGDTCPGTARDTCPGTARETFPGTARDTCPGTAGDTCSGEHMESCSDGVACHHSIGDSKDTPCHAIGGVCQDQSDGDCRDVRIGGADVPQNPCHLTPPWCVLSHKRNLPSPDQLSEPRTFLMLDNLTQGMSLPCVMDLKMGRRLYRDEEAEDRIQKKLDIALRTTCATLGFRLHGLQVYRTDLGRFLHMNKYYNYTLDPDGVTESVRTFFHNGKRYLPHLVEQVIRDLRVILSLLEGHVFNFFSSSVLILYDALDFLDGDDLQAGVIRHSKHAVVTSASAPVTSIKEHAPPPRVNQQDSVSGVDNRKLAASSHDASCAPPTKQSTNETETSSRDSKRLVNVQLIDFEHATFEEGSNDQSEYIFGLTNIITMLESIVNKN